MCHSGSSSETTFPQADNVKGEYKNVEQWQTVRQISNNMYVHIHMSTLFEFGAITLIILTFFFTFEIIINVLIVLFVIAYEICIVYHKCSSQHQVIEENQEHLYFCFAKFHLA